MIFNLKPYPAYKDSGVEWLGKVPEHWEIRRFKTILRERIELTKTGNEQLLSVSQYTGVNPRYESETRADSLEGYKIVYTNDLVVNIMLAWNGSLGVSKYYGIVSPAYAVFYFSEDANAWYYHYLLRSQRYRPYILSASTGVVESRLRLYPDKFFQLSAIYPPLPEQRAIVRFLDWAERRIRRILEARKKRLELLEAYRQTLINDAVTGKFDVRTGKPYPAYKDSGVEWLGKVPEHWEVVQFKRIAKFQSGTGFPVSEQGSANGEIPFLKVSDMNLPGNELWIRTWNNSVSRETAQKLGATVFPKGSIIFPKVGGALLTNKRRILSTDSCVDNNIMVCIVERGNLMYIFSQFNQIDLGQLAQTGPLPAINESAVGKIHIAFPPLPEQRAIAEFLDCETKKIDAAIEATKRSMELWEEFRTTLIAEVVTGKWDVREIARHLPEDEEGATPEDESVPNLSPRMQPSAPEP